MRTPYDYSADVKKLTLPVMPIFGASDRYRLEHVMKFYQLLGSGVKDAGTATHPTIGRILQEPQAPLRQHAPYTFVEASLEGP